MRKALHPLLTATACCVAILMANLPAARAADKIKVGMLTTLSGPAGAPARAVGSAASSHPAAITACRSARIRPLPGQGRSLRKGAAGGNPAGGVRCVNGP